jgi:ppGpp synthetase/RelA/SpoT-type nucleotidyltranferase
MKISASIRTLYEDQQESRERLKTLVDALLKPRLLEKWHYESRVKTAESFTLKVESGRVQDLSSLEDFFAATIVVRNGLEIIEAETIVSELFSAHQRKPPLDAETHKAPEQFPFDDLRRYVRWKDDPALPPTGLEGVLFEVQIKTFLQHAWSIATHDLIYKSDDANWGKMRIAYQIKAMLEHAELSIQEAARLSECDALAKSDAKTTSIKTFIALMTDLWAKEDLPANVRGLAENVMRLAQLIHIDAPDLRALLNEEQLQGRGPLTRNLTPYGIVLQTLFIHRKDVVCTALSKRQRMRVLIPKELNIPEDVDRTAWLDTVIFVK